MNQASPLRGRPELSVLYQHLSRYIIENGEIKTSLSILLKYRSYAEPNTFAIVNMSGTPEE
jgi:hypothetical protein